MIAKLLLPLAAVAMLTFAIVHVVRTRPDMPLTEPPFPPSEPGQEDVLSTTGVVEPQGDSIAVASAVPGVAAKVFVRPGQVVQAGTPLFRLDDTPRQAALEVREAQRRTAEARLTRLIQAPRRDEVLASDARVRAARAGLLSSRAAHEHARKLYADSLINGLEVEQRKQAEAAARAQLEQAEAEDRLLRQGAAPAEVAIAKAQLAEAEALVAQAKSDLERLTTQAPSAGTVLQVHVRPGEAVPGPPDQPPVVLGDVGTLYLRVDLDETLLGKFESGAPARAQRRGQGGPELQLTFVRAEPLLIPKRRLNGVPGERVDTRVRQVIYRVEPGQEPLYVGERLDVFIATTPRP